jgi:hypothetical protein
MPRTELSEPSETPGELHREGGRFRNAGGRFLAVAVAMAAVGLVLIFAANGVAEFFGWVLASLALVPAAFGIGLVLSGLVARRAAKGRSFA